MTNDLLVMLRQNKTFTPGQRLRFAREAAGLTHGQAAKVADLKDFKINTFRFLGYEGGEIEVPDDVLKAMAKAYDVKLEWLKGEIAQKSDEAKLPEAITKKMKKTADWDYFLTLHAMTAD